jgi:hypothetical protein
MIIYKNIGLDNIRKKRKENKYLAHHVKILTISFLIVINIQIIGKYYLSLNWLPSNINIDVNLLTKGSDLSTYQENRMHVHPIPGIAPY